MSKLQTIYEICGINLPTNNEGYKRSKLQEVKDGLLFSIVMSGLISVPLTGAYLICDGVLSIIDKYKERKEVPEDFCFEGETIKGQFTKICARKEEITKAAAEAANTKTDQRIEVYMKAPEP